MFLRSPKAIHYLLRLTLNINITFYVIKKNTIYSLIIGKVFVKIDAGQVTTKPGTNIQSRHHRQKWKREGHETLTFRCHSQDGRGLIKAGNFLSDIKNRCCVKFRPRYNVMFFARTIQDIVLKCTIPNILK